MNLTLQKTKIRRGYALIMVLLISGISLMVLTSILDWASTSARATERNNRYFAALLAAEAATEKVLSRLAHDYKSQGEAAVYGSLPFYRGLVPTEAESPYWNGYSFENGGGAAGQIAVQRTTAWGFVELESQYTGLRGMAATYRLLCEARDPGLVRPVRAAVRQDVQVASIPLFQFAIFYSMDLEINPGRNMNVTGRVHSNSDLYTEPNGATLTFENHVTAVGGLIPAKKPGDPSNRNPGSVVYQSEHDAGVAALSLPIGTNNSPEAVHAVLGIPPAGEAVNSPMGRERYYNKTDAVFIFTDAGVSGWSGSFNSFGTPIPPEQIESFMDSTASFYNKREGRTVEAVDVDVAALREWCESGENPVRSDLGRTISSIYVADLRSQAGSTQSGVRLVNGQTLPSLGLTVATPNPLYVQGHYNVPDWALGTTNTTGTLPASLVSDAITILSENWQDNESTKPLSQRVAASTTVNAALLSGIVPTTDGSYSGGVENFPRFLERWSGRTLTYNGSMVVMFYSQIANAPWGGSDVYSPPIRDWTFDLNFLDATKLPPGTPQLLTIIRGEWATEAPNVPDA